MVKFFAIGISGFILGATFLLTILLQDSFFQFALNYSENLKDFSFLIVAVAALMVSFSQASSLKTQNEGMLRPALVADIDYELPNKITVKLTNHGNGPAVFEDFAVRYNNKIYKEEQLEEYLEKALTSLGYNRYQFYYYNKNGILGKEQKEEVLVVTFQPAPEEDAEKFLIKKLNLIDNTLDLVITYQSLLGHRYVYDTKNHLSAARQ